MLDRTPIATDVPAVALAAPSLRATDHTPIGLTRHEIAVRRTLDLADESAALGDYAEALAWLSTIEAIGDPLPTHYLERQAAWITALNGIDA